MRLLIDSHVLIWALKTPTRLTRLADSVIRNSSNEFFVSHASLWELAAKISRGRLPIVGSSIQILLDEIHAQQMTLLPITLDHILTLERLDPHHSDPFDRMLIAQALHENLTLVTADPAFSSYPIQILW